MRFARARSIESRAPARLSAFPGNGRAAPALLCAALVLGCAPAARAATVQVSKLNDFSLTSLNPFVAASSAQSLCVYSSTSGRGYAVTATGSGSGQAFTLSGGGGLTLAYGVQWSASAGASSGTALAAGVPLTGQSSTANTLGCGLGPSTTASLIVTFATADLQSALAGVSYTGSLTLLITPQ